MHNAVKAMLQQTEKDIKQYEQDIKSGKKESTPKDAHVMFYLLGTMLAGKLLCMIEEMKEEGGKEGKGGMGGMLHAMGKSMGGKSADGMTDMLNTILPHLPNINLPHVNANGNGMQPIPGFTDNGMPQGNYNTYNRGGQGGASNTYGNYNNYGAMNEDPEMRRRRDGRGRYMESDNDMNMRYDGEMENRGGSNGGSGGNGGGQGGNSGGGTSGRR